MTLNVSLNSHTFKQGKKIINTQHSLKLTVQLCKTQNAIRVKNYVCEK